MSGNPFETSLKTLHEAAAIGQINAEVVRLLEQPKRQFEFTIPVRMDDGHLEIFQAFRVHYCDARGQSKNGVGNQGRSQQALSPRIRGFDPGFHPLSAHEGHLGRCTGC